MKWVYPCFGISKQAFYKRMAAHKKSSQQEQIIFDLVKQIRKEMPRMGGLKLYKAIKPLLIEKNIKIVNKKSTENRYQNQPDFQ